MLRLSILIPLLFAVGSATAAPKATMKPVPGALRGWNVVLITLDATDPARIGAYGGSPKVMPFLDSLARTGTVVNHAYALTPETGPSHATMFSSAHPAAHGVTHNGAKVMGGVWWMPEALRQNGYATAGSTIAFFMGKEWNFDRGFDSFVSFLDASRLKLDSPFPDSNAESFRQFEKVSPAINDGKNPFFAWIHVKGGHGPLTPIAPAYIRRFDVTLPPKALPPFLRRFRPPADGSTKWDPALTALEADDPRVGAQFRAYYDANLAEADDALRQLFNTLRQRGLAKKTLFIITADHGETFDHGIMEEHGICPWESSLRIPMVLYSDEMQFPQRRVADRLVTTADIAPTTLELLGLSHLLPKPVLGRSMFTGPRASHFEASSGASLVYGDVLIKQLRHNQGQKIEMTEAQLAKDAENLERNTIFFWATYRLAGKRLLKLIHYGRPANTRLQTPIQLFDVIADPHETSDLLTTGRGQRLVAAEMINEARKRNPLFATMYADVRNGIASNPDDPRLRGLSKETIDALRSLGYLQ